MAEILKNSTSENYKDPAHVWDEINEKTRHINLINYNPTKKSSLFQIKALEHEFPEGILINSFEYPPNSIISLKNIPKNLPNLESIWIFTPNFKSLQGFPKNIPKLKGFFITNTLISDLTPLPSVIPMLEKIRIGGFQPHICQITSLKGLPQDLPNLKELRIRNNPIKSMKYLPESLPMVEKIEISGTNITNLQHLPKNMPKLKELILHHNSLTTLKGMPKNFPNLDKLDIHNNYLSNLNLLPSHSKFGCTIKFQDNPIRTLYGINDVYIKKILYQIKFDEFSKKRLIEVNKRRAFVPKPKKASTKKITLCPSGIKLIKNYRSSKDTPEILQKLLEYYKKSSHELVQQYVSDSKSLNEGEIERLIWEANLDDRKLIENNFSSKDPVLNKISERLKISLNSKFSLQK